jgi:hypothetical protein
MPQHFHIFSANIFDPVNNHTIQYNTIDIGIILSGMKTPAFADKGGIFGNWKNGEEEDIMTFCRG